MKSYKNFVTELFDNITPFTSSHKTFESIYAFVINGNSYFARFEEGMEGSKNYEIAFGLKIGPHGHTNFSIANLGTDTSIKVFSTVMAIMRDFIKEKQPLRVWFTAQKGENGDSRTKLYTSLIKKYCPNGYEWNKEQMGSSKDEFTITKK